MQKNLLLLLCLIISLCTGCSACRCCLDQYRVEIDAISTPGSFTPATYCLCPGVNSQRANPLYFKDIASYLHGILATYGYQEVPPEFAEITIQLDFSNRGPITRKTTSTTWEPITSVSTETEDTEDSTLINSSDKKKRKKKTTKHVTWVPITETHTTQTYLFQVTIAATSNHFFDPQTDNCLWTLSLSSETRESDKRLVYSTLLVSGAPFIGVNSQQKIIYTLYLDDALSDHLSYYSSLGRLSPPRPLYGSELTSTPLNIVYHNSKQVSKILQER